MKIAVGCDHIVTNIKNNIITFIKSLGHEVIDCGTYNDVKTHYPIYGFEVARQIALKQADLGVVICGTGVGITNAANKTKGARCALVRDVITAKKAKSQYNANIIGVGGRIIGLGLMEQIVQTFIETEYNDKNIDLISAIDSIIINDNYEINQFNDIIKKWDVGFYTEKIKQDKISLPETWNKKINYSKKGIKKSCKTKNTK